ncbi:MAG TPA: hypothetical protein VIY72_11155, partial [Acidimicrobiales bacterium]
MRVAVLVAVVSIAGACSSDSPRSQVELPNGDACGEAWFWAATASGDVAVTVYMDTRDPSATTPTTVRFDVPDDAVTIEILEGTNLPRNFCTDLADLASKPRKRLAATSGSGTIRLDPAGGQPPCGSASGDLHLDGLVAEDGTSFAPFTVVSTSIGCYSG